MSHRIRIIQHEGAPGSGSYEVWFPDGRTSQFFYWNDVPDRWLRPGVLDRETARREAKAFAALSRSKKDVPTLRTTCAAPYHHGHAPKWLI